MSTSIIAMLIAIVLVFGMVVSLGFLSLLLGAITRYFEKPNFELLKAQHGHGFAFALNWNASKDRSFLDYISLRLFNPFGEPTKLEVTRSFKPKDVSFVEEVDMGASLLKFLGARGFENARVEVEVGSSKDGLNFQFEYKGEDFKKQLHSAQRTTAETITAKLDQGIDYEVPQKSFIAPPSSDTEIVHVVLPTNPLFQSLFAGAGGNAGSGNATGNVNFTVAKVWIEPGCIVCNACEDIYPEVFDVQASTCVVRPNPPLDNGIKIQEAAEGCPVEVIKFTRA